MKNKTIAYYIMVNIFFYLIPLLTTTTPDLEIAKSINVFNLTLITPIAVYSLCYKLDDSNVIPTYINPVICGVMFVPAVYLIYNDSALVYCIYYAIAGYLGIAIHRLSTKLG